MRVNTGRWGTTKDFDELMANRGIEPRLEGYTDDDGFKWVIDSFEQCLPTAEKCGVTLGPRKSLGPRPHAGRRAADRRRDQLARGCKCTLDTGNFLEDPYDRLEHAGAADGFRASQNLLRRRRVVLARPRLPPHRQMLADHNYHGYVSLEFEGNEDWETAIPKSLGMLREAFG